PASSRCCRASGPSSYRKGTGLSVAAGAHSKRRFESGQRWARRCRSASFHCISGGNAMKLPRRQFLHLAAGAAALPALPHIARAQAYPTRAVHIIVGFAVGAGNDILARLMGQWLSERLGQAFVIENRPGASSNIATEAVVRAAPNGYTLLLVNPSNAINATLYDKLNFNFISDIVPIAGIMRAPLVMEVNPSVPVKTVPDFIAYAKANPGKINMGSAGSGSSNHVSGE